MKKILLSAGLFLAFIFNAFAQSPEGFNYQAVIRDASGEIIANQPIGMQISIIHKNITGSSVYKESFAVTTNAYGLVNLQIGTGQVAQGDFAAIAWADGPYYIETALDVTGGSSYKVMGISQLMSVPYALHAKTAENTFSGDYKDLKNQPAIPAKTSELDNDAGFITNAQDADADPKNELQALSISNDTIFLSSGGFVKLPAAISGNGQQTLSISNDTIFLSNGGYVKLPVDKTQDQDTDPANEIQFLAISGDTIHLSGGGYVKLPTVASDDHDTDPANEIIDSIKLNGTILEIIENGVKHSIDLSGLSDAAYQKGINDGYNMGYNDGYSDGYNDGYSDGYDNGFDDGYSVR